MQFLLTFFLLGVQVEVFKPFLNFIWEGFENFILIEIKRVI